MQFLGEKGIYDHILQTQWHFAGASNMMGKYQEVATLLKNRYPCIEIFHCMAHRLELDVKNAADDINSLSHFRDLVDGIYRFFNLSPNSKITITQELCFQRTPVCSRNMDSEENRLGQIAGI